MNKKIWIPKFNYYSKRLSMWQERLWREVNGKPFMGILDNVAGRKTFEYATFGKSGIQQSNSKLFGLQPQKPRIDMSVSVTVFANAAAQGAGGDALTTQIDRAARQYHVDDDPSVPANVFAYGYGVATENYLGLTPAWGVMDDTTYTDGGSTSRTINAVYYTEPTTPASGTDNDDLFFSLDTTSISNSDTTFVDITWDDIGGTPVTKTRSSATYTASLNSATHWRWLNTAERWDDTDANTDFVLTI